MIHFQHNVIHSLSLSLSLSV